MRSNSILFPWPNLELGSNGRKDRRWLSADRQVARNLGYWIAKDNHLNFKPGTLLELSILICPPDKRRRDDDNILSAFKSTRDGIFKALEMDDSLVRRTILEWGPIEAGGALYVTLQEFKPRSKKS